jgi:hypothetical protein
MNVRIDIGRKHGVATRGVSIWYAPEQPNDGLTAAFVPEKVRRLDGGREGNNSDMLGCSVRSVVGESIEPRYDHDLNPESSSTSKFGSQVVGFAFVFEQQEYSGRKLAV